MFEIKFRFVFRHEGTGDIMFHYCTLDELLDYPQGCERNYDYNRIVHLQERHTLIAKDQYTGLNDKKGEEIYGRDIIVIHFPYIGKEVKGKVIYEEGMYGITDINHRGFDKLAAFSNEMEKLGNIHENPELLKEAENA